MLIQDRIVYRPAQGEVGFYEYHRWAEDPRDTLTKSLIQHLRSRGAFTNVVLFDGRSKTDYIIRGTLERLEEIDSGGSRGLRQDLGATDVDRREGNDLAR